MEISLDKIPAQPGVYMMKDKTGRIIYIGKAKSLLARVSSYFQKHAVHPDKTVSMLAKVTDIDFIITSTEVEALLLENTLIKKHKPRYNILLKDDKTYPFLRITTEETFPRLMITRRVSRNNGSRYFGPYTPVNILRDVYKTLNNYFGFCTCKKKVDGRQMRPCLKFQIRRCSGVCAGYESADDYRGRINQLLLFLEGRDRDLINALKSEMKRQSDELMFEAAARTRDRIANLRQILAHQKVVSTTFEDKDAIAVCDNATYFETLFIRGGRLTGKSGIRMENPSAVGEAEDLLVAFIKQFYSKDILIPPSVLIPFKIDDEEKRLLEEWLTQKRGEKVLLVTPSRGENLQIIRLALENARLGMELEKEEESKTCAELVRLQTFLDMRKFPARIEVFDISNISGVMATGSMIVLENGRFNKREYKKYRIKTVTGSDDFGMLREVIQKRFSREGETPDLVIIDGGKGQLNAALSVINSVVNTGGPDMKVIGLAKEKGEKFERIFTPGESTARILPEGDSVTFLLQRVRDEAHRFAIGYHKVLRKKGVRGSILDKIEGIGAARKRNLLTRFGSVSGIRRATAEEIARTPGVTHQLAEHILEQLGNKSDEMETR